MTASQKPGQDLERLHRLARADPARLKSLLDAAPPAVHSAIDKLLADVGGEPIPQPGPQTELVMSPANEVLFGGGRGGGKTYGGLLDWFYHQRRWGGAARGLIVRRRAVELEDVVDEARGVFRGHAEYRAAGSGGFWFRSGATLRFKHLERDRQAENVRGWNLTWVEVEEAGQFPSSEPIDALRATLRSAEGVRVRLLLNANPGGPGHAWLKSRYVDPAPPGVVREVESEGGSWKVVYIPSNVRQNGLLMLKDPGYVGRIAQSGPEWLVRAWLENDWNIVAGAFFEHLFSPEQRRNREVPPFVLPMGWPLYRAMDWGSAKPFSVGWWTVSNGEPVECLRDDRQVVIPANSPVRVAEWYGCTEDWEQHGNQGLKLTASEVAKGIMKRERALFGRQAQPGPADTEIYADRGLSGHRSIADEMKAHGVRWIPAWKGPGSRINGWQLMSELLKRSGERSDAPGLYVVDTCRHWLRTIPSLTVDPHNPEDVDTSCEDHIGDETRYFLTTDKGAYKVRRWRI